MSTCFDSFERVPLHELATFSFTISETKIKYFSQIVSHPLPHHLDAFNKTKIKCEIQFICNFSP